MDIDTVNEAVCKVAYSQTAQLVTLRYYVEETVTRRVAITINKLPSSAIHQRNFAFTL